MKKSIFALPIIMILVLAACAGGNGDAPANDDSVDTVAVSDTVADPRRAFEGDTLNVILKEGYEIAVIQRYFSVFEEATGININLEVYDEPTTRQLFILDAASGTGTYDVTATSFWYFPEYQINGWLAPIEPFIQNNPDPEWWIEEDIPASALEVFSANGQRYCMPHTIISGLTYYRSDILERHGIEPPRTTEDLLRLVPELVALEPDMIGISGRGAPNFASLGTYLGWAWGYGAQLLDENYRPHANSPLMVEAITDYVELIRAYGPVDAPSLNFVAAGEKMQSGNAIFMFDTSGWGSALEDPTQSVIVGDVGYVILDGPYGRPLQWIYMEGLGISSGSNNKEAAWLFLQWRMSRETTMKELQSLARTDVPNLFVLNSPEYRAFSEENGTTLYTDILPLSWEMADIKYWPFIPEFVEVGDAFMVEISSALAGQQDVQTALDRAQESIERILEDAGYFD